MNEYLASFVDELYNLGLDAVVYSAGSRSTALAMLFEAHQGFQSYMDVDERSAAFFALGLAKTARKPVALVCTSGSAMGHYLPALMEAKYAGVPLILLTADRPPELHHVRAPQTIDQMASFGSDAVVYAETLAIPDQDHYYLYPRMVAQRAYLQAMNRKRGPVHINVPIREPLLPDLDSKHFTMDRRIHGDFLVGSTCMPMPSAALDAALAKDKVLIVAGPDMDLDPANQALVMSLAETYMAPVLADPLSNIRATGMEYVMDTYDAFLDCKDLWRQLKPDTVLQLGQQPVSKRAQQFLASLGHVDYIQVSPNNDYLVPAGNVTMQVQADLNGLLAATQEVVKDNTSYLDQWIAINNEWRDKLEAVREEDDLFEGTIIRYLQDNLPPASQVYVANSMTIRDMDYFWRTAPSDVRILGNRGVNGIDGLVSSALGAAANGLPTVLVTGDLTFFHDLNGLALAKTHNLNLTVVLFNNDGGGIFEYLPQKGTPYFNYLFSTEQGLNFEALAEGYGCDYLSISSYHQFKSVLKDSMAVPGVHILEVKTDKEKSRAIHAKYLG